MNRIELISFVLNALHFLSHPFILSIVTIAISVISTIIIVLMTFWLHREDSFKQDKIIDEISSIKEDTENIHISLNQLKPDKEPVIIKITNTYISIHNLDATQQFRLIVQGKKVSCQHINANSVKKLLIPTSNIVIEALRKNDPDLFVVTSDTGWKQSFKQTNIDNLRKKFKRQL